MCDIDCGGGGAICVLELKTLRHKAPIETLRYIDHGAKVFFGVPWWLLHRVPGSYSYSREPLTGYYVTVVGAEVVVAQ